MFWLIPLLLALLLSCFSLTKSRAKPTLPSRGPLGHIPIFFGTQTGKSASLSRSLSSYVKAHDFSSELIDLSEFSHSSFTKQVFCVIVISTQGEGQPPASARAFYK